MGLFHLAGKGQEDPSSSTQPEETEELVWVLPGRPGHRYFCFSLGPRRRTTTQDLTDSPVVLVGVALVDQGPVPLLEIMKAFMGRRIWSFSAQKTPARRDC